MDVFAFADDVSYFISKTKAYRELMPSYGRELAKAVYGPAGRMSLREASRKSKLSPTYLSNVLNGKAVISFGAYVKLSDIVRTGG
jgi:hypothetical protein